MSHNTQSAPAPTQSPAAGMRGEIHQKWGKFDAQEIAALRSTADLVTQVQTKYALDRTQAQRDVDAFAKGRQL